MFNFQTNALLKSSAIGAAVYTLFTLINSLISFSLLGDNYDPLNPDPDVLVWSSLVSGISCILSLSLLLGAGGLYAYFHKQEAPISPGVGATGGALTGILMYLVASVLGFLISFTIGPNPYEFIFSEEIIAPGMEDFMTTLIVVGVVFGICFGIGFGGITGAIGGFIGGHVWETTSNKAG